MGISVKGRSRTKGTAGTYVSIPSGNFPKAQSACEAFNCVPYFAIVVDQDDEIFIFILSMEKLRTMFSSGKTVSWKMTKKWIDKYTADPEIRVVQFKYNTLRWWAAT
jgi:hypothetical protein